MREMIKAFSEAGHDVKPMVMGGMEPRTTGLQIKQSGGLKKLIRTLTPRVIWGTMKDMRLQKIDRGFQKELERQLPGFTPDVIYERTNYLQDSGYQVARSRKIPYVIEVNAPYVQEKADLDFPSWKRKKAAKILEAQLNFATRVFVVSEALKQYFVKTYNVDPSKISVTHNAVDPNDRVEKSKEAGYFETGGRIVIGFVGSIFPWHGVDLLVEAFAKLKEEGSNEDHAKLHLLIVGDGIVLPNLKSRVKKLNLSGSVTFTGNVRHEEVYSWIENMDITVMARSNWYGSPVKIFEYGFMKKAIVGPDVAPVREVMADGTDGLLVAPEVESIANALRRLIKNPGERDAFAASFHEKVLENHTWQKNAREVLQSMPSRTR